MKEKSQFEDAEMSVDQHCCIKRLKNFKLQVVKVIQKLAIC